MAPSETSPSRLTHRPASIPCVMLNIALPSQFHRFFSLCRCPMLNEHSGVGGQQWPYVWLRSLGTDLHRDCNAMDNAVRHCPFVPTTCTQNAILPLQIIHIIQNCQIYVAIHNPSLVPSSSRLTTSSYLRNYVRAADNVSHAENLQSNCCRCFSHLHRFQDQIQVAWIFRYCGERQG
jgi:hypothetical protein